MAYNLGTVRENVRNRLDDEDFEQEYLDRAINYAQWDITNNHHLDFLEASSNLSPSQGDVDVSLPTDFNEFLFLRLTSPTDLRSNLTKLYTTYGDFIDNYIDPSINASNPPYYWSIYGGKIKFGQPTDQAYTLKLDYLRTSPTLTDDTDVPDIPENFRELLELGAYMRIAKREDDYDVKTEEERDYARLLASLLRVHGRSKAPGGLRRMGVS